MRAATNPAGCWAESARCKGPLTHRRYEQTNARASHILVKSEADAIKVFGYSEALNRGFAGSAARGFAGGSWSRGPSRLHVAEGHLRNASQTYSLLMS